LSLQVWTGIAASRRSTERPSTASMFCFRSRSLLCSMVVALNVPFTWTLPSKYPAKPVVLNP
jgi:hypothetical protein